MQICSLRLLSYSSWKVDSRRYSEKALKKLKILVNYEKMLASGCKENAILDFLEISRSTLYRYKKEYYQYGIKGLEPKSYAPINARKPEYSEQLVNQIKKLRVLEPTWGKKKIHRILVRDCGVQVSESTVGRIISKLIAKGKIKAAYFAANKNKPKRRRNYKGKHAEKWKYGMKGKQPGEMVQMDHMTVIIEGKTIKHFKAVCPVSKFMVCAVYSSASSKKATEFLEKVIDNMPFRVKSIQVDGGSEFMKHFEQSCKEKNIPLFVLPPRSPKYNGCVERCNGTTRDDFYSQYDDIFEIGNVNQKLKLFQDKYNSYRPHQSLGNLTPLEYINASNQNEVFKSHVL